MAVTPKGFDTFTARVVSAKGNCDAGHKTGDVIELSCWDAGGLCGYFFHDIFPSLSVLQFGGSYPWSPDGKLTLECPDKMNLVVIELSK